jgi:hypothetical protein
VGGKIVDLDDEELEATRRLHRVSRDEIKVGEYVRSWNGSIGKVTRIEEGRFLYDNKELICFIASVVKHSKNIIDLIEEGDYVNGYYCKRIPNFLNKMCNFDLNTMEWTPLENIDIWYNILTKEQYNANCFTVKE